MLDQISETSDEPNNKSSYKFIKNNPPPNGTPNLDELDF
jgi:hypothetical protein